MHLLHQTLQAIQLAMPEAMQAIQLAMPAMQSSVLLPCREFVCVCVRERVCVCVVCVLECVKERKRDFCFFVFLICFLFVLSALRINSHAKPLI